MKVSEVMANIRLCSSVNRVYFYLQRFIVLCACFTIESNIFASE